MNAFPSDATLTCGGTYYNGPDKAYGRCDRCKAVDYEKYEGDKCTREIPNDGSPIVTCHTCGCCVTETIAKARRWGTIQLRADGAKHPQCSYSCARVLYTERFLEHFYQEAQS
jgi:hypothetical protein